MSRDTVKQDGRLVRLAHRMVVVRDLDYLHSIDDANAKDERRDTNQSGPKMANRKKVAESMLATQHLYTDHKLSSGSPVIHIGEKFIEV